MDIQKIFFIWGVILLLSVLIYTMIVVRRERKTYKKNARSLQLGSFAFEIPSWWVEKKIVGSDSSDQRVFENAQWKGVFRYFPSLVISESLEEYLNSMVKKQNIVFDPDTAAFNLSRKKIGATIKIVRFEGCATQNETDRIYFDAYLAWNQKTGQALYAESKSSILNGLLEGPYFEECFTGLRILKGP